MDDKLCFFIILLGSSTIGSEFLSTRPVCYTNGGTPKRLRGGTIANGDGPRSTPNRLSSANAATTGHRNEDDNHPSAATHSRHNSDAPPKGGRHPARAAGRRDASATAYLAIVNRQ